MKTTKRIFLLLFSAMLFATTQTLNAQVTIGSELEPNKGSLLDLKEDDTAPGANSTKGFNLPRVSLTSVSSLEPCVTNASDADKANHKGLQVYNTDTTIGEGVYTWNGETWLRSSEIKSRNPIVSITRLRNDYLRYTTVFEAKVFSFSIVESGYYLVMADACGYAFQSTTFAFEAYLKKTGDSTVLSSFFFTVGSSVHWGYRPQCSRVSYLTEGDYELYFLGTPTPEFTANWNGASLAVVSLGF